MQVAANLKVTSNFLKMVSTCINCLHRHLSSINGQVDPAPPYSKCLVDPS